MSGGIVVMEINYGPGKIKKQLPFMEKFKFIEFHLVNSK